MAENKNIKKQQRTSNAVPLTDILYRTLHYWPWVILSVIICVGLSVFYLLKTPKMYSQTASILIKDDGKGKSTGAIDDFGDFGLFSNNTNIENEMTTFKSRDLMGEVVRRMNLDMNYYLPGRFHKIVAYGTTLPIVAELPDCPDNSSLSFQLDIDKDRKVKISDIEYNGEDLPVKTYSGNLNDTIKTSIGRIIIKPTPTYEKDVPIDLTVIKQSLDGAEASYLSRLTVGMSNEKGTIIDLTFIDQNIQRADDVLSTIIGVYNENWIRDKNQIAVSTSNFINERLNVIESELGNVDSDISSYKSEHLVPDVNAAASSYMAESQALSQELLGINNQLQMTRYIRNYLNADQANEKVLPTNTGVENLELESQISQYNSKLLERNNLRSKSSSENPLVQNLDFELSEMRSAIIASVDNSIVNLQNQIKSLQGARGAATSRLASNPNQAKYLLSVERQQKVKESLYLFLLQKREDNELNQAFTAYNSRVINEPGGSRAPISPDSRKILLVAFLIGLAIPFGVVYVKENGNTKVRGRKDLENMTPPLLGEIPQYGKPGKKGSSENAAREILVKAKSRNIINEAFRVLRTNTEFSRVNKEGCNVIALTSFNPGSGKSFITMNLATAMAIKGKRVLVIDGDMRHGSSSGYVQKSKVGLSDYLSGETNDIMSILVTPEDINTLQVLPIGTVPPNPTELLESPRFGQLIEQMRPHYDYIIIDCPPIEVVADAQIIDQYADRTIFIVRAGLLERSMLAELDRLYDEKKYKHMAVILNGTRNDQGRYGYSHTYKYGYGYGYGYGYNYVSKSKSSR
ncbi:MAG: polysaccharide biosynthesis tyrosine autokinase [Muribaculum sp.]|nr:polysaccharide biosynthesis tyrosine autokinase [Muribaculum sp.]